MALVLMFLCNQFYASHDRDFVLGATILNSSKGAVLCTVQVPTQAGERRDMQEVRSKLLASSSSSSRLAQKDPNEKTQKQTQVVVTHSQVRCGVSIFDWRISSKPEDPTGSKRTERREIILNYTAYISASSRI